MNGRTINVFWWTTGMTRMKYAVRFDMISGARNGYGGPATMTRTILTSQQKNSGASRICSLLSTSSSLAHFSSIGCFLFTSTHSVACLSTFSVLSTVILFSMVQSPQLLFFFFPSMYLNCRLNCGVASIKSRKSTWVRLLHLELLGSPILDRPMGIKSGQKKNGVKDRKVQHLLSQEDFPATDGNISRIGARPEHRRVLAL